MYRVTVTIKDLPNRRLAAYRDQFVTGRKKACTDGLKDGDVGNATRCEQANVGGFYALAFTK